MLTKTAEPTFLPVNSHPTPRPNFAFWTFMSDIPSSSTQGGNAPRIGFDIAQAAAGMGPSARERLEEETVKGHLLHTNPRATKFVDLTFFDALRRHSPHVSPVVAFVKQLIVFKPLQEVVPVWKKQFQLPTVVVNGVSANGGKPTFSTDDEAVAKSWGLAIRFAHSTIPIRSREQNVEKFGGSCDKERYFLHDTVGTVEEEKRTDPSSELHGVEALISKDGRLPDIGYVIDAPKHDNPLDRWEDKVSLEQTKVANPDSRDARLSFTDLLAKDGKPKYAGMRVAMHSLETGRTFVVNDGATIAQITIHLKADKPSDSYSEQGIDSVHPSPTESIKSLVRDVRAGNITPTVTRAEFNWLFPSADHATEALGVYVASTQCWETVEPCGQGTKIDTIIVDMTTLPSSLRSAIESSVGSEAIEWVQNKPCTPNGNAFQCRSFGSLASGLYSIHAFRSSQFANLNIDVELDDQGAFLRLSAWERLWMITNSEFVQNECGHVFYENASDKDKEGKKLESVRLHCHDLPETKPPNPNDHDWRWTRFMQLCNLACAVCCSTRIGRTDDLVCEECGGEMTPFFEFPVETSPELPEHVLQSLLKQILDHNEPGGWEGRRDAAVLEAKRRARREADRVKAEEEERDALETRSGQEAMAAAMAALPVAFAVNIDAALPGVPFAAAYPIVTGSLPRAPAHPIA